nr:5,6-dihydroxyindole-2-carboxylic acid oxidase-like [Ciona intestinalis]|eukprot:XP_002119601.1 5,6-dihydroxyindole-2-carboxylic acid oxidase-like [Ciona intestinalis]
MSKYVFAFALLLCSPLLVYAQFPRACATLEAILSHECCPELAGTGSSCGELEGRGSCQDITIDDLPHGQQYVLVGIDDRERWPERFFNRSCVCNGNFGGFDCSGCKPGWEGDDCLTRRAPAVRQNIMNMTAEERNVFLDILDLSKTTPHPDYVVAQDHYRNLLGENGTEPNFTNISIYDLFVWVHYYSVRDTLLGPGQAYTAIDFSHEGPAFLTWHRMHLLGLENDLQDLSGDPTFALPYWDFAIGGTECDVCTDELLGGQETTDPTLLGSNSRFADWEVVCLSLDWFNDNVKLCNGTNEGPIRRNPGGNIDRPAVQSLPVPEDVAECLKVAEYDTFPYFSDSDKSFRNALEGYSDVDGEFEVGVRTLHNLAHLFLNGTGGMTHASANDPIFVLLHTFTDAIFEEWMLRSNATVTDYPTQDAPIGHNLDFNMVPFFPPVTNRDMFVPSDQLGYSYAVQFPETAASETAPSFVWAIVGVSCFVILAAFFIMVVNVVKKHRQRVRDENLYQSLITEDSNKGIHYTA